MVFVVSFDGVFRVASGVDCMSSTGTECKLTAYSGPPVPLLFQAGLMRLRFVASAFLFRPGPIWSRC